jgi:hypothetical protein
VIRDELGAIRAAGTRWLQSTSYALSAEAEACQHGLHIAQVAGLHDVVMETNCKVFVDLWQSMTTNRSEISVILSDLEALSLAFSSFSLTFVNREANLLLTVAPKRPHLVFLLHS